MKSVRTVCIALLLLAAGSIRAAALPRLIMVNVDWPPFRMINAQDSSRLYGIDIDLLNRLEELLGLTIEVQQHPWARALEMLRQGQADIMTGLAYSDERAAYIEYVPTSYYSVVPVFYARKGQGRAVRTYEDLRGKTIGISKSSVYFEPFNSDTSLLKQSFSTEEQILHMLVLGRIDLAVGTEPNIAWDTAKLGYRDQLERTAYMPPGRTALYLGFSRRSKYLSLLPSFDAIIQRMLADGSMEQIVARYR